MPSTYRYRIFKCRYAAIHASEFFSFSRNQYLIPCWYPEYDRVPTEKKEKEKEKNAPENVNAQTNEHRCVFQWIFSPLRRLWLNARVSLEWPHERTQSSTSRRYCFTRRGRKPDTRRSESWIVNFRNPPQQEARTQRGNANIRRWNVVSTRSAS